MSIKTITLPIKGMSCSSCSRSVENQVENLKGLVEKRVDHDADSGEFIFDENLLSQKELIEAINQGYYKVELPEEINLSHEDKNIPVCPVCKVAGAEVPNTVMRSNLKPDVYKQTILEDDFHICMNPDCSNAYYSTQRNQRIDKSGLKRELYYKEGTEKQIICYCNNVDRDQIEDTVLNHNITDWDVTMERYSNKVQEKCEILNPTGLCCRDLFDEVVDEIREKGYSN